MSLDQSHDAAAVLALTRFGFGVSPGRRQAIRSDPRGAVAAEVAGTASAAIDTDLPGTRTCLAILKADQQARKLARAAAADPAMAGAAMTGGAMMSGAMTPGPAMTASPAMPAAAKPVDLPYPPRDLMVAEATLRLGAAAGSPTPMVERLVAFWSNHFCVATDKDERVLVLAGPYERGVIRPHVLGRFEDMLAAVVRHPAMLTYLDNDTSVGPGSELGLRSGRGLNENLAREILELHTVGVGAGYGQADVTAFARVLTGWTFRNDDRFAAIADPFAFNEQAHEPGDQTVMGRRYPDDGLWQGLSVLRDLARHPATARHVATKLATAFVADPPPPALVDGLARRFLETGGDLREVSLALVGSPEAWSAPRSGFVTPYGFVAAIGRVAGAGDARSDPKTDGRNNPWRGDVQQPLRALQALGQPLWRPPAPKGFAEGGSSWLGPAAMTIRVEVATAAAQRMTLDASPAALADALYGEALSAETRQTLRRSESGAQGLALLFMSPEFQRR